MKKLLFTLSICLVSVLNYAQTPEKFKYQAVVRDGSGNIVSNATVGLRASILKTSPTGSIVFSEEHNATTNATGLINLSIGSGALVSGSMGAINWGTDDYFLRIEIDMSGGTSYSVLGTTQLLSVPYALHAKTVENDMVDDADADPSNELQTLSISNDTVYLSNGGFIVLDASNIGNLPTLPVNVSAFINDAGYLSAEGDPDPSNELQVLSFSNDTLYISSGNFIVLPAGFDGDYNSLANAPVNVSDFTNDAGYLSAEGDADASNELQVLSVLGDSLYISNGNAVFMPTGFDGDYSSLSNAPTGVSYFINDAGYLHSEVDGDATNELVDSVLLNGNILELYQGGSVIPKFIDLSVLQTVEVDGDTLNELQNLLVVGDSLFLSKGNAILLPQGFDGDYNSLVNAPVNVSEFTNDAGYLSAEVDADASNELQVLSFSNDTLYISSGNFIVLPAGFDGDYNSLANAPVNVSDFINDAGYLSTEMDDDPSNEKINSAYVVGDSLFIDEGAETFSVNLSSFIEDADADSTNELLIGGMVFNDSLYLDEGLQQIAIDLSGLNLGDNDKDSTNEIQDLKNLLSIGNNANAEDIVNVGAIGIGTATPNPKAALEISSTTGGLLMPRMNTSQRDALGLELGMMVYNSQERKMQAVAEVVGPEILDQSQLASNSSTGGVRWQSFTPDTSGLFSKLDIQATTPFATLFFVYQGQGTGGTLLHSENISHPGGGLQQITFDEVELTQGVEYTFGFFAASTWAIQVGGDPLPGGRASISTTSDFVFNAYIVPLNIGWVDLH